MTEYLLDTNVVSETIKSSPSPRVIHWIGQQPALRITSVTLYELRAGIEALSRGKRRNLLDAWCARVRASAGVILPFDEEAAIEAARLGASAKRRGRRIPERDLLILAIASANGLGVATRNTVDFEGHGVDIYDPFGAA